VSSVKLDDAGRVLSDTILRYMSDLDIDNGLLAVGYSTDDIPALVKATLPQVLLFTDHFCGPCTAVGPDVCVSVCSNRPHLCTARRRCGLKLSRLQTESDTVTTLI